MGCVICQENKPLVRIVLDHQTALEETCKECQGNKLITDFQKDPVGFLMGNDFLASSSRRPYKIQYIYSEGHPVFEGEEWDFLWLGIFSARCMLQGAIALLFFTGGYISQFFAGESEKNKEFVEANTGHRLTPLFMEYYGITEYTLELKPTLEERTFTWIRSEVGKILYPSRP